MGIFAEIEDIGRKCLFERKLSMKMYIFVKRNRGQLCCLFSRGVQSLYGTLGTDFQRYLQILCEYQLQKLLFFSQNFTENLCQDIFAYFINVTLHIKTLRLTAYKHIIAKKYFSALCYAKVGM
jgi:hypothetical protein